MDGVVKLRIPDVLLKEKIRTQSRFDVRLLLLYAHHIVHIFRWARTPHPPHLAFLTGNAQRSQIQWPSVLLPRPSHEQQQHAAAFRRGPNAPHTHQYHKR